MGREIVKKQLLFLLISLVFLGPVSFIFYWGPRQEIVEKETVKSLSRKRREHKELISFNVFFVFFFLNDFTLDSFIPFLGQRFFNETIVDQENERRVRFLNEKKTSVRTRRLLLFF